MTDLFVPIAGYSGPTVDAATHPVSMDAIVDRLAPLDRFDRASLGRSRPTGPVQTNKFFANMMVGTQGCAVWTHPYSVAWAKGRGPASSWGIAVCHTDRSQVVLGPTKPDTGAAQYYFNPVEIFSIIFSAVELGGSSTLKLDSPSPFSAVANVSRSPGDGPAVSVPMVQGMGLVTAAYNNSEPVIETTVFFRSLEPAGTVNSGFTTKHRVRLESGATWLLYVTPQPGRGPANLVMADNLRLRLSTGLFSGIIQTAKVPTGGPEDVFDRAAGAYATGCDLAARWDGARTEYKFRWSRAGSPSASLLMFALPHHLSSFDRSTAGRVRPVYLPTTTKGMAAAVEADEWTMVEATWPSIGFVPWSRSTGPVDQLPPDIIPAVIAAAQTEVNQDVRAQSVLDSMYFSGKGLAKFAMIAIVLHDLVHDAGLTNTVVGKLKEAFDVFVRNQQPNRLVYDVVWKGVISSAGLGGDAGADFGNSWYNDHHFHYGYFVYTAAVLTHIDPGWMAADPNRGNWTRMLVADFANPVTDDRFPHSRSFDWYAGHSWAKGIFESADGKDQESTSEDGFASYALMLWGRLSGDLPMEGRGCLMLAIQARVFATYFLMDDANTAQPGSFIGNKVTGILFENKADHATYFGSNLEYIQGIHMIPLNPSSPLTRSSRFVAEEWDKFFSRGRVDQVAGGWRGILYANLALIDPSAALGFFASPNFRPEWLDGGASLTWYLAFCSALRQSAATSSKAAVSDAAFMPSPAPAANPQHYQQPHHQVSEDSKRKALMQHFLGVIHR